MKRIEYEMRERGISQTALAEMSGVNRTIINNIIHAQRKPYPKWRAAIANALDWPEDRALELFDEIEVQ